MSEVDGEAKLPTSPTSMAEAVGNAFSRSMSTTEYADAVHSALPRGHGAAAEHASYLFELLRRVPSEHVGINNAPNGADRIVEGVLIQTKYCSTGSSCVAECFENSVFRYTCEDGSPMQVEVPRDLYEDAVLAMRARIKLGQVPGVVEPNDAERIIRKGYFTYNQARNIGRAGTLESITYDAATGIVTSTCVLGLSFAIQFFRCKLEGATLDAAVGEATKVGIAVGGTSLFANLLAKQLARSRFDAAITPMARRLVSSLGPDATRAVAASLGKPALRGAAAASYVAKALRGNVAISVATTALLSAVDVYRLVDGRISGGQAFKNMVGTASSVAGGGLGWVGGAALGATVGSVLPVLGTGVGLALGFLGVPQAD